MKFWQMGKDKNKEAPQGLEMTALEKRLAEKAALETEEEEAPQGPKNMKEAQAEIDELNSRLLRLIAERYVEGIGPGSKSRFSAVAARD